MIRVVIADDHHLVREGIRMILEKANDIRVVGEAEDGSKAVDLARKLTPDVLVMDVSMPGLNGVMALEKIRALNLSTRVVMLSMHSNEMTVRKALKNGAKGYLLKDSVSDELLLAVRAAKWNATYLSPKVSETLISEMGPTEVGNEVTGNFSLTPRELEMLQLIGEGLTNKEISDRMNMSVKTGERHRANLMSKMGVSNLVELIRVAIKNDLISLDE